jgi:hypothetical protein
MKRRLHSWQLDKKCNANVRSEAHKICILRFTTIKKNAVLSQTFKLMGSRIVPLSAQNSEEFLL